MKHLAAVIALIVTTACSTVKPVDLADVGTTAAIIAQGGVEMNPIVGVAGDSNAPLVALGLKAGVRYVAEGTEYEEELNSAVDAASWIGTCNNVLQLTTSLQFEVTILFGTLCGVISFLQ